MWIKKNEIATLSVNIRKIIDGEDIDIRQNDEGIWNILKNDIHILAKRKNEQVRSLEQDKNLLKDTLADISHQIKTPLTSMIMMADLLENASPEKQEEFIQNIKLSLHRTEWLVSYLLKIAKLEAGVITFNRENINSTELVEWALNPLQIQLELKEQHVKIIGSTTFHCDKRWTAEALSNILKNASEHSPTNSEILIQVDENPICSWISVTNSGKGLTKAQLTKLFCRFESSENVQGHGIGLPLALAIMRGQSGDIEVASSLHEVGTTLTLKLFKL